MFPVAVVVVVEEVQMIVGVRQDDDDDGDGGGDDDELVVVKFEEGAYHEIITSLSKLDVVAVEAVEREVLVLREVEVVVMVVDAVERD